MNTEAVGQTEGPRRSGGPQPAAALAGTAGVAGPIALLLIASLLAGCSTRTPTQSTDLCALFEEKPGWYRKVRQSVERWGGGVHVVMAIMRQESAFQSFAKPPRKRLLGILPGPRPSNAFGYAQALDSTWEWYMRDTERAAASRNAFSDAADFIAWYNRQSHEMVGVALLDTYNLYLAYHEGQAGFRKKTFEDKPWLLQIARKVSRQSATYQRQLSQCEENLQLNWLQRFGRWLATLIR